MESFLSRIQYMNYASAGWFVAFSINVRLCNCTSSSDNICMSCFAVCTSVSFRSAA